MFTALLLLSLSQSAEPAHPCPRVEYPALSAPVEEWTSAPVPWRECPPTQGVAALMYELGIDAAAPVEVTEVEADIYAGDVP